MLPKIHDATVIAFSKTEVQSDVPCGIVIVQRPEGDFVTAWYRTGDSEWSHGHYFTDEVLALQDFQKRVWSAWHLEDPAVASARSILKEFVGDIEIIGARIILTEALVSEGDTDPGWPDLVSTYERAKAWLGEPITEDLAVEEEDDPDARNDLAYHQQKDDAITEQL